MLLLYEGWGDIGPALGARADQDQGTPYERLVERACRICYDSFGRGRSSEALHEHLKEVKHGSVWEHAVLRVEKAARIAKRLHGWKGWDFRDGMLYVNLRLIREYDGDWDVKHFLKSRGRDAAPQIVDWRSENNDWDWGGYISLRLEGSRGWSHEQVRHRYAMSQRSTRYVDEGRLCEHPLLKGNEKVRDHWNQSLGLYKELIGELEQKGYTRKEARGAARQVLPHGLWTEMIFTAPMHGWRDMVRQRKSEAADAEIRGIFEGVDNVLEEIASRCTAGEAERGRRRVRPPVRRDDDPEQGLCEGDRDGDCGPDPGRVCGDHQGEERARIEGSEGGRGSD